MAQSTNSKATIVATAAALGIIALGGAAAEPDISLPAFHLCRHNIASAELLVDSEGEPCVLVHLTTEGTRDLKRFTTDDLGKRAAIRHDDELLTAAQINGVVDSGIIVTAPTTEDEAKRIKERLATAPALSPCGAAEGQVTGDKAPHR